MKVAEKHKLKVLPAILKRDAIIKSNGFGDKIEKAAVALSGGNF